jgi:ferrochelatase
MPRQRGILLVNLGSPDSPSVADVRRYLGEFLMDGRVLDVPYLFRRLIVSLAIQPFRSARSAEAYQSIWWDEGSPLIVISRRVQRLLQEKIEMPVALGMSYGSPSIEQALRDLLAGNARPPVDEVFLVPLYPHYAMSTYETVQVATLAALSKINDTVPLTILPPFYNDPLYIRALVASARDHLEAGYDHLLFSYHGLPERHLRKTDPTGSHCLRRDDCCTTPSPVHRTCYRAQVLATTKAFVQATGIPQEKYSVAFQSRLGRDKWLGPATNDVLSDLGRKGVKRLLVICPAFVSDCLETLEEIGIRGKETFCTAGGETLELIPCLNEHPLWIDALKQWCTQPPPKLS